MLSTDPPVTFPLIWAAIASIHSDQGVFVEQSPARESRKIGAFQFHSGDGAPGSFASPPGMGGTGHTSGAAGGIGGGTFQMSDALEMVKQSQIQMNTMCELAKTLASKDAVGKKEAVSMREIQAKYDAIDQQLLHKHIPQTALEVGPQVSAALLRSSLAVGDDLGKMMHKEPFVKRMWEKNRDDMRAAIISGKSPLASDSMLDQLNETCRMFLQYALSHYTDVAAALSLRAQANPPGELREELEMRAQGWNMLALHIPRMWALLEEKLRTIGFYGQDNVAVRKAMVQIIAYALGARFDLHQVKEMQALGLPPTAVALEWASGTQSQLPSGITPAGLLGADKARLADNRSPRTPGQCLPSSAEIVGKKYGKNKDKVKCGRCDRYGHEGFECLETLAKQIQGFDLGSIGWTQESPPKRMPGYFVNDNEDGPMNSILASAWLDHAWDPQVVMGGFSGLRAPESMSSDRGARRLYGKTKWYEWADRSPPQ